MIYLDNAATSLPKPQSVTDAVVKAMSELGGAGRGGHPASLSASRTVYKARTELAGLFGCLPENTAFTQNATESLNTAINGLLTVEDHVITTALDHNSVLRPLYRLKSRGMGLSIIKADSGGRIDYADFERALSKNTKAVVCTHASNLTGDVLDIRFIADFCKANKLLFILDAAQTAGILPLNMREQDIDVLCFTGHKSLFGPQGTGGICLREGLEVLPLKVGGSGIKSFDRLHPSKMPEALEAGTINAHGIAGLLEGIRYVKAQGLDRIYEHGRELEAQFRKGAAKITGIRFYGGYSEPRTPVAAINIGDIDSAEIADALSTEYGVCVRGGSHCAPLLHEALDTKKQGAVRFSFSSFNTDKEVAAALKALSELSARYYG